jgi:hypothetical protein
LNPFKDQSERRSSGSTVAAQGGPGRTGTQKPLVRAKERQPAAIQAWLERGYPAIARRAKTVRGVIYWGDETGVPGRPTGWGGQTGLSNQDQIGRS